MRTIIYLLLFSVAVSCTKEISIDLDKHESKLVVNSFFSNHKSIAVNVSKSISIFSIDTLAYVSHAKVELYNNNVLIGELLHTQKGNYELATELEVGIEYTIEVNALNLNTAKSHDVIPDQVSMLGFDTISLDSRYLYCELAFHDNPAIENYYLLDIETKTPYVLKDSLLTNQVDLVACDLIVENGKIGDIRKLIYFSDEYFQSEANDLSFLLDKKYLSNVLNDSLNVIYINLKSISKAYYDYLKTNYVSQNAQIDVYTNIENGYGIFAGYSLSQDSIVF